MKGKTLVIGLVIFVLIVVAAVYFMAQATFKNNPVQKNHQSSAGVYEEHGSFGWQSA